MMIGFFVIGFLFRFWVAGAVPQPFVFDQEEYYGYVLGMLQKGLHADLYRLYGYPLIIAGIVAFFGVQSAVPWTIFHAILDTITALMVYWIAKRLDSRAAWIAFIVYLFNPYTGGYTGVLLSEVATIFLVTIISVLILGKKSPALVSLLLGFLPQVRPVFIGLSLIALVAVHWKRQVKTIVPSVLLFCLPFLYTIAGNLVYYRQFSILGVEPTFVRELYASLFIGRGMPFTDTKWGDWPPQVQNAWGAFTAPKDASGRSQVAGRYLKKATDIIRRDPAGFVRSRFAKMGYVWEKHFIYPYVMGKPSAMAKALTYWGNITFLAFAALGAMISFKKNRRAVLIGGGLFLYITLAHIFSTSEERFSLPAYPWIAVFAGYALAVIACRFRRSSSAVHPAQTR